MKKSDALAKFCSTAVRVKGDGDRIKLDPNNPHDKEFYDDDDAAKLFDDKRENEVAKQELKDFAVKILTDDYEYSTAEAREIVNNSNFGKMLELDYGYTCHYDIRDWVIGMVTEIGGRGIITSRMYRNAVDYVRGYEESRESLIQSKMEDHGLSRESAERSIRHADVIYQEYIDMKRQYEIENGIRKC